MRKITRIIFAGLSLSIITFVFAFFKTGPTPAQAPPPVVPVRVTNIPLPVQGAVNANVTNTVPVSGSVNANITNTVPVSGTVNANLTNPPLLPLLASDTTTLQTTSDLSVSCGFPGMFAFDRSVVKSGGTVVPFTLPAGMVFVATSLDWSASGAAANGNPSPAANLARTASLVRVVNGGLNGPSAQSTSVADANGRAGGSETFPTGVVLQNPGEFCLAMDKPVPGERLLGVLQGFLAPDR